MKDKDNRGEKINFSAIRDSACKVKALEDEIQRLKSQISRMTGEIAESTSVVKVLFKNDMFLRKYKSKVELFLKDLLVDGEEFMIHCEMQDNTEQEFEELHQAFHIDKFKDDSCTDNNTSGDIIPCYSKTFEDVLHHGNQQVTEKCGKEKHQAVTCFNCLGDHHMKKCPEKLDRLRIAANKKDLTVTLTNRYHEEERKNLIQPGCLSSELREAMGLKSNQLPQYIYRMRVIGYPPGWMKEAILETSGLSLYDSDGKIASEEEINCSTSGIKYDASKFVNYPGFNSPVPDKYIDEWNVLDMPPLQQHQQLSEALKSPNTIINNSVCKRKPVSSVSDAEIKKLKNGMSDCNDSCSSDALENNFCSTLENEEIISSPRTPNNMHSHSLSLSKSEGTPILEQGNPYNKLPDADKFAQGITEHLPFENLPDAVGKYEKMRGVLSGLQKKLNDIRS